MSEDHEQAAKAAERDLADMQERSERVGEHIEAAREDWKAKVADGSLPAGEPESADDASELPPPDPYETD
jgi:hypothetical protein